MAFIPHQSCECTKSELDVFVVPPTQASIEYGTFIEYNPISSISQGNPIEFSVTGAGQDYLDLSSTQLYVRAQIVKVMKYSKTPTMLDRLTCFCTVSFPKWT